MERLKEKPYIGVTGVANIKQAETISQAFIEAGLARSDSKHIGMMGFLASPKTLSPNFQGTVRYPTTETIRQITEQIGNNAFNVLHYHTYRVSNLGAQLEHLFGESGLYPDRLCQGVQLNLAKPPIGELAKTRLSFPHLKIILQLGPRVLTEQTPEEIVEHLAPYVELINYALIDPSGGRGRVFQINKVAPVHNRISAAYPNLPLAFAGGFDARNAQARLWLLFQTIGTTNFGIDAEGGLRIQHHDRELPSPLSTIKAYRYIQNAAEFFKAQA